MSTILIVPQGIIELYTDAVVNAANEHLFAGGGVCGILFDAAGYNELQDACNKIGHCDTGKAVITPAFALKGSRYIIHAVGPIYQGGKAGEAELLSNAYRSALDVAMQNDLHSVGFPLISAGIFGYPLEEAWTIALTTCKSWIEHHPTYEMLIKFGVPGERNRIEGLRKKRELKIESTYEGNFC